MAGRIGPDGPVAWFIMIKCNIYASRLSGWIEKGEHACVETGFMKVTFRCIAPPIFASGHTCPWHVTLRRLQRRKCGPWAGKCSLSLPRKLPGIPRRCSPGSWSGGVVQGETSLMGQRSTLGSIGQVTRAFSTCVSCSLKAIPLKWRVSCRGPQFTWLPLAARPK